MGAVELLPAVPERYGRMLRLLSLVFLVFSLPMCQSSESSESSDQGSAPPPAGASQLVQQAYLKASNSDDGDWSGSGVAVSGDTVVMAARNEDSAATGIAGNQVDNSATDSGAAYVFIRTGGVWIQQAYLKGSNTKAGDRFGYWVDMEGDTLVVGAPLEDGTGAVYIFTRTGGVWSEQASVKASNGRADDWFGSSVALSGDTLVVGARFEDSAARGVAGNQSDTSAPDSGAAYVFTRTGGIWTQQAYIKASNTRAGDHFGFSVDVSGNTLVVGAREEDSAATGIGGNQADVSAPDSGAAYVFTRAGEVWNQEAYVKASNTGAGDWFGNGVALAGDTLLVGAPLEDSAATGIGRNQDDNSAPDSGAAYVFTRTGGVWNQEAYVKASNTGAGDNLAFHVAMTPDTLLVGAHLEDSAATGTGGDPADDSAPDSGAAYVFTRTPAGWTQLAYVKASNTKADNWLGSGLAVDGDTVVVGASKEDSAAKGIGGNQTDSSAPESGAVYVFQQQ